MGNSYWSNQGKQVKSIQKGELHTFKCDWIARNPVWTRLCLNFAWPLWSKSFRWEALRRSFHGKNLPCTSFFLSHQEQCMIHFAGASSPVLLTSTATKCWQEFSKFYWTFIFGLRFKKILHFSKLDFLPWSVYKYSDGTYTVSELCISTIKTNHS